MTNNLLIASDHAGFNLKKYLLTKFTTKGFKIEDMGSYSDEPVDYPDLAKDLCRKMSTLPSNFGILICGSGIGMSIAANRYSNTRAALCCSNEMAKLARQHNDANVLVLGSKFVTLGEALEITVTFLSTRFEGGRHIARVGKL
ncbi:MAG: ribose 5-phosphate isomerase B [Candidatus Midichloria mitochondrii]|nr:ribose 5-phosphate isomerase B [Candidatus Midichloria mitochondrii]MDJ1299531.1 ribose 5-phosphate isomerase B [Candidatus Midichloria mitochondrii]